MPTQPPVVLIHGAFSSGADFDAWREVLVAGEYVGLRLPESVGRTSDRLRQSHRYEFEIAQRHLPGITQGPANVQGRSTRGRPD